MERKKSLWGNIIIIILVLICIKLLWDNYTDGKNFEKYQKEVIKSDSLYFEMLLKENEVIKEKEGVIDSLKKKNLELHLRNDSISNSILLINKKLKDNRDTYHKKLQEIDSLKSVDLLMYFRENLYKN